MYSMKVTKMLRTRHWLNLDKDWVLRLHSYNDRLYVGTIENVPDLGWCGNEFLPRRLRSPPEGVGTVSCSWGASGTLQKKKKGRGEQVHIHQEPLWYYSTMHLWWSYADKKQLLLLYSHGLTAGYLGWCLHCTQCFNGVIICCAGNQWFDMMSFLT